MSTDSSRCGSNGPSCSVMHVLDTEGYAGRESVVHRLAAAQLATGRDVRVAAVVEEDNEDTPFLDAVAENGIPTDVLRLPPRAYLTERRHVAELIRDRGADVLHSHGYRPDVVGASAARAVGVATVSTVHGFVGGGVKNRLYEWLQRRALRRVDRVVGVSAEVAEELVAGGVPSDRVCVVRNAWGGDDEYLAREEARDRLGLDPDAFVVGWVGRLSREKGLDVLLDALLHWWGTREVCLSVVGEGPQEEELRRQADRLPRGVDIHWHGRIRRASRLFRAFDVLVLSSRTEGTPMVLLEAMAAGVPVVSTAVGGVPDVVSADEAWLVPPGEPDSLRSAVTEVQTHPDRARERASAAAARLDREFGRDEWVSEYDDVYREAVTRAGED